MRKNIYKWHKLIGLATIVPVILWCTSGLMHPFLAHWFKPKIAREFIIPKPIQTQHLRLTLKEILQKNDLTEFKNFRITSFQGKTYYQVKNVENTWLYFDTETGEELLDGDRKYAEYLARYFLADSTHPVKSITQIHSFNQGYKYINRLLPVWKVSFDRPDGMDVYVETPYSRLGTFNPISRKIFLWIFDNFHNWTFLTQITNNILRIAVILFFLGIIILSSLSGIIIYGFMWGKFKKTKPENKKGILRKYHRQIGIAVAFVSFTFAFSGGYHATRKIQPNRLPEMIHENVYSIHELNDLPILKKLDSIKYSNLSLVKVDSDLYYQVFYKKSDTAKTSEVMYIDSKEGTEWKDGDEQYATYLCKKFKQDFYPEERLSPHESNELKILKTDLVTSFEKSEYGFVFKRLPVIRVALDDPEKTNYYIETATSRLSARIENSDRYEGYSFAILHKYLLMDWAGKTVRDIVMMISALGVLVVSILGLVLFLKK